MRSSPLPLLALLAAQSVAAQALPPRIEPQPSPAVDPGRAFAASALLPGLGQRMLGQDRWVPYAVVEVWSLLSYIQHRSDGRELEKRYRDLAWEVARRVSVGERRDPSFDYYESLTSYEASGAFDADPGRPGIQPEPDATTYNGNVWRLARSLYVPGGVDPTPGSAQHQQALDYYLAHAIGPELAWAWGSSVLEQRVYAGLIRESDEAFRAATQALGLVVANHLVSAIDALVSARLRSSTGLDWQMRGGLEGAGARARWRAEVRIGW